MANRDQQSKLDATRPENKRRLHLREVTDEDQDDDDYGGVGWDLRAARLSLNMEPREVAANLHIRRSYVQAIEEGRFGELPASVYAYGFVRSYAELLGLDEDLIVRRFKDEWEGLGTSAQLAFPEPPEEIRLPRGPLIAFSLLLVVAVYGGWYYMSNRSRTEVEKVPEVPERLASGLGQGDAAPDAGGKPAKSEALAKAEAPAKLATESKPPPPSRRQAVAVTETPAKPAAESKPPPPEPSVAEQKSGTTKLSPAFIIGDDTEDIGMPETRAPAVYGLNEPGRVVVRAKADTWVQIQVDREVGEVFLTRILHTSDEYRVPARNDLFLMTGNAGGLEILVDGRKVDDIGALGVVRRRVLLVPDLLIKGDAIDEN